MAFRLGYRPALDGVRGLAILSVMAVHAGVPFPVGGFLSVDLFFVLSGFLITSVLLEEWDRNQAIRLGNFYVRRGLRLLPGLTVFLVGLLAFSLTMTFPQHAHEVWREVFFTFFYVANWALAFGAMPGMGILGHAWTLAIEEQFYMLWPLLLLSMLRTGISRRRVALLTSVLIAAAALHRLVMWEQGATLERVFFGFDTRCDSLLAGCVAGIHTTIPRREGAAAGRWLHPAGFVAGIVLAAMAAFAVREEAFVYRGGFTLMAVSAAILLLDLVENPRSVLARVLSSRLLVRAGRISYGLYLWHWPIFLALNPALVNLSSPSLNVLRFAVTWALAELSFALIERPALSWKRRWRSEAPAPAGAEPRPSSSPATGSRRA